jgi:hypothetical protein
MLERRDDNGAMIGKVLEGNGRGTMVRRDFTLETLMGDLL